MTDKRKSTQDRLRADFLDRTGYDMNIYENSSHEDSKVDMTQEKLPYSEPVLKVYGSVRELTQGAFTNGNDGGAGRKNPSDRTVKQNIVRIGEHPLGFGLYLFDYRPELTEQWGQERQFGVMADEVETVVPNAVSIHSNGYKMVDYAILGIDRTVH